MQNALRKSYKRPAEGLETSPYLEIFSDLGLVTWVPRVLELTVWDIPKNTFIAKEKTVVAAVSVTVPITVLPITPSPPHCCRCPLY